MWPVPYSTMRMVYTDAPDEDFFPARDRLVDAFTRWAHRMRRAVDPFVVEVLIEQRWSVGDGRLSRWQPADLRYALIEYFPRGVTTNEWSETIPTVHAFVDFLFDADLADAKCAGAAVLHATLDGLAEEYDVAMADETRYGPAKFWSMRMLAAGVNLEDPDAMNAFIADVQAGKVPYDEVVLAEVVRNQLTEDDETPPALPPVDPPSPAAVATAAASGGRAVVVVAVNDTARAWGVRAGELVRVAAQTLGGGGGGKDDIAQGGGTDGSRVGEALAVVEHAVGHVLQS